MDPYNSIKAAALQISGIFSRMNMGQYSAEQAMTKACQLTYQIEKSAETMESQAAENLKKAAAVSTANFRLQQQLSNLQAENKYLKEKNANLREEIFSFTDDSFLEGCSQDAATGDGASASQEMQHSQEGSQDAARAPNSPS